MSIYGDAPFLAAQLESLAAQEGVEVQLFVRDDGASDEARAVLSRYADRWPQLAEAGRGHNVGPAGSFLELLRAAPAGYVGYAFCDQDDVWLPDKLARGAARLAEVDPRTPALFCSQVTCVTEDLQRLGPLLANAPDPGFAHIVFENIAIGMTTVMNETARALVVRRLPARGLVMHDWWCALVVAAFGRVIYDAESRVLYRQHGKNVVGGQGGALAAAIGKLRGFVRDPSNFHPIHGQAQALLEIFGAELAPANRQALERLVAAKRSLPARLAYALAGPVRRSRWTEGLFLRVLISLGWY